MDRKAHWEKIYTARSHRQVSWFADHVSTSLDLIRGLDLPKNTPIIDVGGGASTLVDDLVEAGYSDITVLDIAGAALEIARMRLEALASSVRWIEEDVLESDLGGRTFGLWHDRAVFHFLIRPEERECYLGQVEAHLRIGGILVLSVFADDGPEKCSGLDVQRHDEEGILRFFGERFRKIHSERSVHTTPAKAEQKFVNVVLERRC